MAQSIVQNLSKLDEWCKTFWFKQFDHPTIYTGLSVTDWLAGWLNDRVISGTADLMVILFGMWTTFLSLRWLQNFFFKNFKNCGQYGHFFNIFLIILNDFLWILTVNAYSARMSRPSPLSNTCGAAIGIASRASVYRRGNRCSTQGKTVHCPRTIYINKFFFVLYGIVYLKKDLWIS